MIDTPSLEELGIPKRLYATTNGSTWVIEDYEVSLTVNRPDDDDGEGPDIVGTGNYPLEAINSKIEYGDLEVPQDEPETCQVEKSDGEICGRELPCRYHSDESDEEEEEPDEEESDE